MKPRPAFLTSSFVFPADEVVGTIHQYALPLCFLELCLVTCSVLQFSSNSLHMLDNNIRCMGITENGVLLTIM